MTIKAQQIIQPDPRWWPTQVRGRLREALPDGVSVVVREDLLRRRLEVSLSESFVRRVAGRFGLTSMSRTSVMVRARMVLSDAPAGLAVDVRWS